MPSHDVAPLRVKEVAPMGLTRIGSLIENLQDVVESLTRLASSLVELAWVLLRLVGPIALLVWAILRFIGMLR